MVDTTPHLTSQKLTGNMWKLTLDANASEADPFLMERISQRLGSFGWQIDPVSEIQFRAESDSRTENPALVWESTRSLETLLPIFRLVEAETPTPNGWELSFSPEQIRDSPTVITSVATLIRNLGLDPIVGRTRISVETWDGNWIGQSLSFRLLEFAEQEHQNNRPRKLTPTEIESILIQIPNVRSANPVSGSSSDQGIRKSLERQLAGITITPLGIPELTARIVRSFEQSQIDPGTTVGSTVAESLSQPITQMALKSFHQSGSSKNIGSGIEAIKEILWVSQKRKHDDSTIYFKNSNYTFSEIMDFQGEIIATTLKNLLVGFTIEKPDDMVFEWWHHSYLAVAELPQEDFESRSWVLRLEIKPVEMYARKVTPHVLAAKLNDSLKESGIAIPSPISVGRVDIFINEGIVANILDKYKSEDRTGEVAGRSSSISENTLLYMHNFVVPILETVLIKGIPNIDRIYPTEGIVWKLIREQIPLGLTERGNGKWRLIWNQSQLIQSGIPTSKVYDLLAVTDITILTESNGSLEVEMPESDDRSPGDRVIAMVSADRDAKLADEKVKRRTNPGYIRPATPIEIASKVYYAETDGSNIIGLLSHPLIDSTRTTCNNINKMYQCFGIEAARLYLMKDINAVIADAGSAINTRHIGLLVDFMTNLGKPNPISFTGMGRTAAGALTKASMQQSLNVLLGDAMSGSREQVRGVSTAIITGQRSRVGTGFFDVRIDTEAIARFDAEMDAQIDLEQKPISISDFEDALAGLDESMMAPDQLGDEDDDVPSGLGPMSTLPARSVAPMMPKVEARPGSLRQTTMGPRAVLPQPFAKAIRETPTLRVVPASAIGQEVERTTVIGSGVPQRTPAPLGAPPAIPKLSAQPGVMVVPRPTAPSVVPRAAPPVVPRATPTVVPRAAPTVVPRPAPTVVPRPAPMVVPRATAPAPPVAGQRKPMAPIRPGVVVRKATMETLSDD